MKKVVAAVESCMEARLQEKDAGIHEQLKVILGADKVYIASTAGPDGKILSGGAGKEDIVGNMRVAIEKGGASIVGVMGHYDCAGHKVSDNQHIADTVKAAEELEKSLSEFEIRVVPLIARPSEEEENSPYTWVVEKI